MTPLEPLVPFVPPVGGVWPVVEWEVYQQHTWQADQQQQLVMAKARLLRQCGERGFVPVHTARATVEAVGSDGLGVATLVHAQVRCIPTN